MIESSKVYQPKEVEAKWYRFWEKQGYFHAEPHLKKKPYSIVIPPPNVTGILHMGHALNNTIQDILIRWKRMQGYETLWMPGTDHAGIATQNVVEKALAKEGKRRQDLGREAFVERVWKWREEYGSTIIQQLKRLGASCDWARTRFTMDEGLSAAVQEVFIRLYHKGLIYRGNYIINWCPRCQTALSDEEAVRQEVEGKLYYIRYPIKGAGSWKLEAGSKSLVRKTPSSQLLAPSFVVVATTRPETLLGDVAVAVNPKDERFRHLRGKTLILPVLGRELKIIEDDFVDPVFGTGAVKVTPAHDPNDFDMGRRHDLEPINVMHPDGRMNENAGSRYSGKDRFECRKEIIEQLEQEGLLEKIEKHLHAVGHCYRCHTVVEPRLSLQWFVRMKPLAQPAIRAVQEEKLKFYPERWTKVYLQWLENVRDWCISRQIWWGHRIPVWYCQNCHVGCTSYVVRRTEEQGKFHPHLSPLPPQGGEGRMRGVNVPTKAGEVPQKCKDCGSTDLVQDEDVLDTWFSSWLWPFSTMGWPEGQRQEARSRKQEKDNQFHASCIMPPASNLLNYFYPTNALVTAPEILFFWVARMVMAGFEFMGESPFSDVYLHGTVRDTTGKKMSKSLGNIIDPLDVIDHVGADALRFSLMSMAAQGTDIYLSEQKFDIGRNFGNKIWNAARFILMNINEARGWKLEALPDRWILSRLQDTIRDVTKALEEYQFNEASRLIYEFFWSDFCDWYIEISKLRSKEEAVQTILITALETTLRLLHPIMPFITEEVWQKLKSQITSLRQRRIRLRRNKSQEKAPSAQRPAPGSIMLAEWPKIDQGLIDPQAEKEMAFLIEVITSLRNLRTEFNIGLDKKPGVLINGKSKNSLKTIQDHQEIIQRFANLSEICYDVHEKPAKQVAIAVAGDLEIYLPLEGIIDLEVEKKRLTKQIDEIERELKAVKGRLENNAFVEKAPKDVIDGERKKQKDLEEKRERLKRHLASL